MWVLVSVSVIPSSCSTGFQLRPPCGPKFIAADGGPSRLCSPLGAQHQVVEHRGRQERLEQGGVEALEGEGAEGGELAPADRYLVRLGGPFERAGRPPVHVCEQL